MTRKIIISVLILLFNYAAVISITYAQENRLSTNNYASIGFLVGMGMLVLGILLAIVWVISLRRTVKNKISQLTLLDKNFDSTIAEKLNAVALKNEAERKSKELEETKKTILKILGEMQEEKNKLFQVSRRLKLATESANIGVWDWDIEKDTFVWDDIMCSLYGIKKEDFSGTYAAWLKVLHPDDRQRCDKEVKLALKGEKDFNTSFRIVWPSGEVRYIKAFAIVERNNEDKPIKMIGVNFDITHEKEIDIEKTEFVSLASHQLKTPVGSINWNLEMLLNSDYGPLSDKQKEVVSEMYSMNQRMNDLINSLLNVSRIELGVFIIEPLPADFGQLCDEVLQELEPRIKAKQHSVSKKFGTGITNIPADPKLLRIIFQNYISNAIKYTRDNGMVSVIIEVKDNEVVISVSNNGDPIPDKDKDKIFTKLFRASNAQEQDPTGNGLGLYIVKKIAENGGGKVWFDSDVGKETTFYASFPLSGMLRKAGSKKLS